jgi:hypothetical protein
MTSKLSDDFIAHIARAMTDAEAPARLRARVMAGIDQSPAPRRLWWVPVFATAAVAVTIVALWPRSQAPALPALPSLVAESAPIALDAASLTNEAAAPSTTRSGSAGARRVNVSDAKPSAEELEFRARAIPALDRPAPLAVEAIQPQPLSIPLLVISPLSSTAVTAGGDGK